jgi:hypothetical protein
MSIRQKRRIKYLTFTLGPAILILMILIPALSMGQSDVSQVPAELLSCTECHNDSTLITGKDTAWAESLHGTGEAYLRGTSAGCAGCHSGGGFSAMVAAGQEPHTVDMDPVTAGAQGDPNPTRQDCRACHQIHNTYTGADWALETTAPVTPYKYPTLTYDGGKGNLCAKCHQPRSTAPVASGGNIAVTSTHFGPHHGPESTLLLGTGGAGAEGTPSPHYSTVTDTCVSCHLGSNDRHTFAPEVATCKGCHTTATSLDVNGVQTAVQAKLDTLKGLLVANGLLACEVDAEGIEACHSVLGTYPEAKANALWNWILIAEEDGSKGVHNVDYTNTLLDASIAAFTP